MNHLIQDTEALIIITNSSGVVTGKYDSFKIAMEKAKEGDTLTVSGQLNEDAYLINKSVTIRGELNISRAITIGYGKEVKIEDCVINEKETRGVAIQYFIKNNGKLTIKNSKIIRKTNNIIIYVDPSYALYNPELTLTNVELQTGRSTAIKIGTGTATIRKCKIYNTPANSTAIEVTGSGTLYFKNLNITREQISGSPSKIIEE